MSIIDRLFALLAQAIFQLNCIRDRFRQANISLEQPYLNSNSQDIYNRF
ncbi:MAG TPA: hypothetical protein V6C71_11970 [Coleofasciculaceae cyanobacterium]